MSVQGDERWEINIYFLGALSIGSALLFPAGIIGLFRGDVRQLRQRLPPGPGQGIAPLGNRRNS